jgi:SAM-dependent methyltransferase
LTRDGRTLWEHRASNYGARLNAVLFARLPDEINAYVHQWHCRVVARHILDDLALGARVLDLGCGYGRIGTWLHDQRPDLALIGLDFTLDFCRHYAESVAAPAVCADIAHIPFLPASFDAILAITVLMYTDNDEVPGLVDDLLILLKPGGILLAIDPGAEYLGLSHRFGGAPSATGGVGFSLPQYRHLAGVLPARLGGMPGFSLLLPLARLVTYRPSILAGILAIAERIDRLLPWASRWTLHRWLRVQVPRHSS